MDALDVVLRLIDLKIVRKDLITTEKVARKQMAVIPLAFMIETKVMEVAGTPAGAKLLYYPLQIRQKRIRALLDSGASVNCIDEALVRYVGGWLSRKLPGTLLYPDRRKAIVRGTTELEVRGPGYREKLTFWVMQGLGVSVLLGAPWLRTWNPTINWKTRELTFSDGVR